MRWVMLSQKIRTRFTLVGRLLVRLKPVSEWVRKRPSLMIIRRHISVLTPGTSAEAQLLERAFLRMKTKELGRVSDQGIWVVIVMDIQPS